MSDDEDSDLSELVEGVIDVMEVLSEQKDVIIMMQILASAMTSVLCSKIASEEEAQEAYGVFNTVVCETLNRAKKSGMTMWAKGTPH